MNRKQVISCIANECIRIVEEWTVAEVSTCTRVKMAQTNAKLQDATETIPGFVVEGLGFRLIDPLSSCTHVCGREIPTAAVAQIGAMAAVIERIEVCRKLSMAHAELSQHRRWAFSSSRRREGRGHNGKSYTTVK